MSANTTMNRVSRGMMDFFFPRRCPFCGRLVGRELLCGDCREKLPWTGEHAVEEGGFGRCASPLYYEESVREAILALKFGGKTGALDCFGRLLAECAAEHYMGEFDTVSWVPISRKRLKKRGFDQCRLLAASLCVDWHVAPVETLRKVADNPAQSGLATSAQRRANVLGVYEAVRENVVGRRILLLDDILTTGATLNECVRVLREAGAAEVVCLTLARTRERKA